MSDFSKNRDNHLRACLADIIAMPVPDGVTTEVVQLPFREGGLGLRSAARLAPAACWACWADFFSQAHTRAPEVCTQLLRESEGSPPRAQHVQEAQHAAAVVAAEGMEVPEWSKFSDPHFLTPQPLIQRWESGLMVGNFMHLLLATPSLQQACICLLCQLTTKLCGHLNVSHALPDVSLVSNSSETTFTAEEFRTLLLV